MISDNSAITKLFFQIAGTDKKISVLILTSIIGHILSLVFPFLAGKIGIIYIFGIFLSLYFIYINT